MTVDHKTRIIANLVARCESLQELVLNLQQENSALCAKECESAASGESSLDAQVQAAENHLFALKTKQRQQKEESGGKQPGVMPFGSEGRLYCPEFCRLVQPLYDQHMGCENMGPMLYNLVRFNKPKRILEVVEENTPLPFSSFLFGRRWEQGTQVFSFCKPCKIISTSLLTTSVLRQRIKTTAARPNGV